MKSSSGPSPPPIPASLRSFLQVTADGGTSNVINQQGQQQQQLQQGTNTSDLISRLEAFLPELEQANKTLPSINTESSSIVDVHQVDQPKKCDQPDDKCFGLKEVSTKRKTNEPSKPIPAKTEPDSQPLRLHKAEQDGGQMVEMDLFVDNSMGKLVPCQEKARQQGEKEIGSLIRELGSSGSDCDSKSE